MTARARLEIVQDRVDGHRVECLSRLPQPGLARFAGRRLGRRLGLFGFPLAPGTPTARLALGRGRLRLFLSP
jgi:hypothetical protein